MCIHLPDITLACGCPDCRVCIDRELPLPLPTAASARKARLRDLLACRHFKVVAIETPLARTPIIRST